MSKTVLLMILLLICAKAFLPASTQAAISACSASVNPTVVRTNTSTSLSFSVQNSDSANTVSWVKITAPSTRFTITSGTSSGWSGSVGSPTDITYTGGTLSPNSSASFNLNIQTSNTDTPAASWTVEVSDNGSGSGSISCSGSTSVAISGDTTPPVISNIAVSNITSSSVSVSWTTDEASTTVVNYGPTTSYGSNASSGSLTTSH